jgi:hypothetical protein
VLSFDAISEYVSKNNLVPSLKKEEEKLTSFLDEYEEIEAPKAKSSTTKGDGSGAGADGEDKFTQYRNLFREHKIFCEYGDLLSIASSRVI